MVYGGTAGRKGLRAGRFKALANLFKYPLPDLAVMRSTTLTVALALALLLTGAAGCLGSDDTGDADIAPTGDPATAPRTTGASTTNLTLATFPIETAVNQTTWANGSFQPHQACNPAGCATGQAYQTTELTDLADAVPVHVTAELTFDEPVSIYAQPMEVAVVSEEATFYTYQQAEDVGRHVVTTTFLPGGSPVEVQVLYRGQTGQAPEESYALRIDVTASQDVVPAGVPVTLPVDGGDTVRVEPTGESDGVQAVLFGPQDDVVARTAEASGPVSLTVPEATGSDPMVLLVPEGGPSVRVWTNTTALSLQALGLQVEMLEPQDITGPETVAWSFEVDGYPFEAGIYFQGDAPLGATADQGNATLASPEGTVTQGDLGCGTCIVGAYETRLGSPVGDPGLVPGTYEATYEPGGSAGMQVGGYLVWYKR